MAQTYKIKKARKKSYSCPNCYTVHKAESREDLPRNCNCGYILNDEDDISEEDYWGGHGDPDDDE